MTDPRLEKARQEAIGILDDAFPKRGVPESCIAAIDAYAEIAGRVARLEQAEKSSAQFNDYLESQAHGGIRGLWWFDAEHDRLRAELAGGTESHVGPSLAEVIAEKYPDGLPPEPSPAGGERCPQCGSPMWDMLVIPYCKPKKNHPFHSQPRKEKGA